MAATRWAQQPFAVRFWSKVEKSDGCWLWRGYVNHKGYGVSDTPDGHRTTAHRVAWVLSGGHIPDGFTLDHLCRVRACVNPDHLDPVTNRENVLRGDTLPAANLAKTKCPRGHPLDVLRSDGSRYCRTCKAVELRRYKARRKELAALLGDTP